MRKNLVAKLKLISKLIAICPLSKLNHYINLFSETVDFMNMGEIDEAEKDAITDAASTGLRSDPIVLRDTLREIMSMELAAELEGVS